MNRSLTPVLLALAIVVAGCDSQPSAPATTTATAPATASAALTATSSPIDELHAMDERQPVPLQPMMAWHQKQNMMEHLVAIQRITAGLAEEDWEEVEKASALIETSPQMQQMCQHMGAGAPGFTEMALEFHSRADAIGEAARAKDATAALRATSKTLESCTGCHAVYRQEVVSAQAWHERTGSAHVPPMQHGGH
jgi:hypothetical protein